MNKTLLIIEDEDLQKDVLKEKFEKEGYEVLVASDGQEGLNMALEKHPDVILLDIILPKITGISMLTKLRKDVWGKNAKVVLFSNLTDLSDFDGLLEEETKHFIKAETKLSDIVDAVNKAVN